MTHYKLDYVDHVFRFQNSRSIRIPVFFIKLYDFSLIDLTWWYSLFSRPVVTLLKAPNCAWCPDENLQQLECSIKVFWLLYGRITKFFWADLMMTFMLTYWILRFNNTWVTYAIFPKSMLLYGNKSERHVHFSKVFSPEIMWKIKEFWVRNRSRNEKFVGSKR